MLLPFVVTVPTLFLLHQGSTSSHVCQLQPPFFVSLQTLEVNTGDNDAYCKYDDHLLQLFTSSLFLAGAVSAIVGMFTCRHLGRKSTMMLGALCFLIGSILMATSFQVAQLVIGRIVLGFGVGLANTSTPLYLSEMAPWNLRGALNICFQMAVTIGIFAAQLINYGTQVSPDTSTTELLIEL